MPLSTERSMTIAAVAVTLVVTVAAIWTLYQKRQPIGTATMGWDVGEIQAIPNTGLREKEPSEPLALPANSLQGVTSSPPITAWRPPANVSGRSSAAPADAREVIPPEERWEIDFDSGLSEGDYARQLDDLGIETAVVADAETLIYASNLATADPERREGPRSEETRMYWTWSRGDLVRADRVLLQNAGIGVGDRVVLHFLAPETERRLQQLEREFENRSPSEVYRTTFAIRRTFRGYELYVREQVPR